MTVAYDFAYADHNATDYLVDATFQGLAYYTMSSMTNDAFKLARMAAYYKGIQSAGSAVSFGMDAAKVRIDIIGGLSHKLICIKTPYLAELLISWLLIMVSLPLCAWVLHSVRDTNYDVEEVVHVDDTK